MGPQGPAGPKGDCICPQVTIPETEISD
jgi:hypothetical protein